MNTRFRQLLVVFLSITVVQVSVAKAAEIEGAATFTYLNTSAADVANDYIGVMDMDIAGELGQGRWHIYLEGTSTSKEGRVSDVFDSAYADAGAAADGDGDGRLQLSGLEYYHPIAGGELVLGLLYPSGFTESGDWANDETTQFISSPFVNIATSGSPDYALGVGYIGEINQDLSFNLLLSQANGLGDIDGTYAALFDELDEYFFSAELVWHFANINFHANYWASSADTDVFTTNATDKNRGINLSLAYLNDLGHWLVRFGTANDKVSEAEQFWGVSWQKELGRWAFGLGASQSKVSAVWQVLEDVDDVEQYEAYVKFNVNQRFHLTGSWQKISNAGFGLAASEERDPRIFSVRTSVEF